MTTPRFLTAMLLTFAAVAILLALSRFLSAMVYGISTTDAPTFVLDSRQTRGSC